MMRQSNMEVIRIIAMSMILLLHIIDHTTFIRQFPIIRYFMPMVIGGVDLFILISGYYLIKLRWQSLLWFVVLLWSFQSFVFLMLNFTGNLNDVSYKTIIATYLSPLTNNEYWFIQKYFMLMLISPLINPTLKIISNRKYIYLLTLLTIIEIYAFWLMQIYNKDTGVSLYNFIYLYILGHSLHRFEIAKRLSTIKITTVASIALLINLAVNAFTLQYFRDDFGSYMNSYTYNYCNPFTIAMCVGILLILNKRPFLNRKINSLASASLGAYLLQDGMLGTHFIYQYQADILRESVGQFFETTLAIFTAYWLISWILTYCTRKLIFLPLTVYLDKLLPNKYKFNFSD